LIHDEPRTESTAGKCRFSISWSDSLSTALSSTAHIYSTRAGYQGVCIASRITGGQMVDGLSKSDRQDWRIQEFERGASFPSPTFPLPPLQFLPLRNHRTP